MADAIPRPAGASARRLIVNADDFGRSESINRAVIRAHREGILTTASLMTNEPAFAEAVAQGQVRVGHDRLRHVSAVVQRLGQRPRRGG